MAFPVPETPRRDLFPEIEPYATGFMPTDGVHEIYYEESGRPDGKPVLVLHGGAADRAALLGLVAFDVSLTHSRSDAMAFVVAYRDPAHTWETESV